MGVGTQKDGPARALAGEGNIRRGACLVLLRLADDVVGGNGHDEEEEDERGQSDDKSEGDGHPGGRRTCEERELWSDGSGGGWAGQTARSHEGEASGESAAARAGAHPWGKCALRSAISTIGERQ